MQTVAKPPVTHPWRKPRNRSLQTIYGLTQDSFWKLYVSQEGKCKICQVEVTATKIHVDHDHKTGKVRGLLCQGCNLGLGQFKDNPASLAAAIIYLKAQE